MNIHPKVQYAGLAGAVTIIIVTLLSIFSITLPPEAASALTMVLSFLAGYLKSA